jgi:2-iminobutanoate/2-iminopropanoate deaminase
MKKKTMHVPHMLNEAYDYDKPVPFSRGMRLDFGKVAVLVISGTASVNEMGVSAHVGDLRAQAMRTYQNITELLKSEAMTWHDVVHTRIFLRDIDRDYESLSKVRFEFFQSQGLKEFPASTCVEARLCRPELLVEIETVAMREQD